MTQKSEKNCVIFKERSLVNSLDILHTRLTQETKNTDVVSIPGKSF